MIVLYRVIQNFASPSRAENRQASEKLTISPSNTFNLKWENQILDSETFWNCCKFNFPKIRFCVEMIRISSISSYLPSCFPPIFGPGGGGKVLDHPVQCNLDPLLPIRGWPKWYHMENFCWANLTFWQ